MPVSETNLRQFTFDCVERLSRLTTQLEVSDELRRAGGAFGFGTFCYAASGYVHLDPMVWRVRQTTMPFGRHEAPYGPGGDDATKVMNEATEFGVADGLAVPIDTTHGFQAIVTFGADQMVLGCDGRAGLHLIAIYAHGRAR